MKRIAFVVVLLLVWPASSVLARSFSARTLSDAHVGTSKAELTAQRSFSWSVVQRLSGSWQVAPRHSTCWSHVPWSRVCDRYRRRLILHRQLLREAQARLARYAVPTIAHLAGWNCIHNGAYPGAPHEGWSEYGTYTGPLQMTTPWEGYYYSWGRMSYTQVYMVAEKVAADHGFDPAWMAGQWPNTYPPCASLF